MLKRLLLGLTFICGLGLIAACDSAEERAEKHFQAALEHIENGDVDRAIIEFRNVFKLNDRHKEARLTYARLQRDRGDVSDAYGQYLRLVEQYPDNLEGRRALTELAVETGNWEEVERHGKAAAEIAPDDPVVRATLTLLDYRAAIQARDTTAQQEAFEEARKLLAETADLNAAHQIAIDHLIRTKDWQGARVSLDAAIASTPYMLSLYTLRLGVLHELGDDTSIEAQFQEMLVRFPEDENIRAMLLQWYVSQGDIGAAEAFLRNQIDPLDSRADARVTLVQFLAETRGAEAARAELERIIAADDEKSALFRAMRAALIFEAGDPDAAITEMEEILDGAAPSPDINDARVTLARMLLATGNVVGARAQVEETLATDPSHVAAVKLKAGWLIEDDRTDEAIVILRDALGGSPRDPELMTLLARAHERNGNRDLMAEMLALAVEASARAPDESLRYASYLSSVDKRLSAESVLLDALRLQPTNQRILTALGALYIELQNWARAQGVIDRLSRLENGSAIANELNARTLAAQGQEDELMTFLERLASEQGAAGAGIGIIRTHLARGDLKAALNYVDKALQDDPRNMTLRFVHGAILAMSSEFDKAAAAYRVLLEEFPESVPVWAALYRLELIRGDATTAARILDEALTALPDSAELQWARAVMLEQADDIDGAINIYERLYERDSNNPIISNNLASLLASYRDDADSLDRAWRIARRLRGSEIPAFQDTYGWIAYRRGDLETALNYLEPAARDLPGDPLVQYHLAVTYAALDRNADALELLKKVVEMTGSSVILDKTNTEIDRIEKARAQPEARE